jgi:hypothetical protein
MDFKVAIKLESDVGKKQVLYLLIGNTEYKMSRIFALSPKLEIKEKTLS